MEVVVGPVHPSNLPCRPYQGRVRMRCTANDSFSSFHERRKKPEPPVGGREKIQRSCLEQWHEMEQANE